jgi:phage terminase large subunit-like protein
VTGLSLLEQLAELDADDQAAAVDQLDDLTLLALAARAWPVTRRPAQDAPPGSWSVWLFLGGRGTGKTRGGSEWTCDRVDAGLCTSGGLANRTFADVKAVQIEGESGLVAVGAARGWTVEHVISDHMVRFYDGARRLLGSMETFTADVPDGPRGRGLDTVWADELGAWPAKIGQFGETCWTNLEFALRSGPDPRALVTTTPKPTEAIRALVDDPGIVRTSGTLYDNVAFLAPQFVARIRERYEGTRLAAQEIHGELVLVVEGALWTQDALNLDRWTSLPGRVRRRALGVDPAVERGRTGIVLVAAAHVSPTRLDLAVLGDYSLRSVAPETWGAKVDEEEGVDVVVAERNQGGQMVKSTLTAAGLPPRIPVKLVRAVENKRARAEWLAVLQDRHRLHMLGTEMVELEGEMTGWDYSDPKAASPDRLDALVHAATDLRPLVEGAPRRQRPTAPVPGVRQR